MSAEVKYAQEISFSFRVVPASSHRAPDHVRTQASLKKALSFAPALFFLGDRYKPFPIDGAGPSVRSHKIIAIPSGINTNEHFKLAIASAAKPRRAMPRAYVAAINPLAQVDYVSGT